MKRLEQTNSQSERFAILKRLAFAYDNYEGSYEIALGKYLQDESQIKELIDLKKNWGNKKYSLKK